MFTNMAEVMPCGVSGNAAIDHFKITKDTFQGLGQEQTRPGTYARLKINGATMMSDTDMERRTNRAAIQLAYGDVLIGGLGIGMITLPICRRDRVSSVTVIEKNPHVIALVEQPLRAALGADARKLVIREGDIHKWRPAKKGRQFDLIYFDIWLNLCTDQVDEMKALHAFFRRYARSRATVTSWEFNQLVALKRRGA